MLVLAGMASIVGTIGVVAAFVLVKLIALVTNLVWYGTISGSLVSLAQAHRGPWMMIAPPMGGLIVGLMARYGSEKIRGHGIPEAIETILIGQSRIAPRVAVLKPLSSAIAIGTGGPFGAEGPIIMTGGALGSLFAQFFDLSSAERKVLLVSGAVAGMTAIFGTPIAACLLAIELLLFEWKPRSFIPAAVAALVAIAWRPLVFGTAPLFPVAIVLPAQWWTIPLAGGFGVIVGFASIALTLALYRVEDAFHRLPIHWTWWPSLGGLVVGLGGLVEPRALGVGYDVITSTLSGQLAIATLVSILLVKSCIWLVALGSGTSGGVLAPLLIIGGALGALIGLVLPGSPAIWALLGMAAMLGGALRAPLTGAIFAVELTGDLHALPLLLAATVCAFAVSVLLLPRSILTEKIARRGQHITQEYAIDRNQLTRVGEIMVRGVETLAAEMPLAEALARTLSPDARHVAFPVIAKDGTLVGVLDRTQALRSQQEIGGAEKLHDTLATRTTMPDVAHPEDVVARVVDLMIAGDQNLVPVTERATGKLVGIVTRKDLLVVQREAGALERERARFFTRTLRRHAPASASNQHPSAS
ncbi:Voltage-gated chloride channel protein [Beijerinckiaceae bacterium RH AL1]|nr:Voltage-gated chloride channel protein [Beijerinckiaceae bacterium RH CH11]VVB49225.1 Voltage-gated chloride channel protein [Beijerinckiaceae bacterium RH AL8]VVC56751.1 Voltage-gated chloride channel protein [Beijerinckiaceae bacterium RH AL1]